MVLVLVLVSVRRSALDFLPSNGEQWLRSAATAHALGVRCAVQSYVGEGPRKTRWSGLKTR